MKRGPQNSYRFPIDSALPYLRSGASGEQRDREGNASMQVPFAHFGLVSSQPVMRSIVWNDSRRSSPSYEAEAFSRNAAVPSGSKRFIGGPLLKRVILRRIGHLRIRTRNHRNH